MRIKVIEEADGYGREAYWCPKCRFGFYVTYEVIPPEDLDKLEAEWNVTFIQKRM